MLVPPQLRFCSSLALICSGLLPFLVKQLQEILARTPIKSCHLDRLNYNDRKLLCLAVYGGHVDIVRDLLHYVFEVNSRDKDGRTVLALAAYQGSTTIVNELIG